MKITKSGVYAIILLIVLTGILFLNFVQEGDALVAEGQKGATIYPYSSTDFGSADMKQSLNNLRSTGANYVSFVIPYYQTTAKTIDIQRGNNTPTDESLISAIQYAHSIGLKVMLKMHLDISTNLQEWRADISPADRTGWYANYGAMLNYYAVIAQQNGVEDMCLGTELLGMAASNKNADNTPRWLKMITDVRARFNGKLTYSSNWGPNNTAAEESDYIGFWSALDYIGISAYYNLPSTTGDVETMKAQWDAYNTNDIRPLQQRFNKPILFTEVGFRSVTGAHSESWNWGLKGPVDEDDQARAYEAMFSYWNGYSYMQGFQLWFWQTNPNAGGPKDTDYTPQNKKAEAVMKKWFGGASITPPPPVGKWSTTVTAPTGSVGVQQTLTVKVTAETATTDANVDVEIFTQSGIRVSQKYFDHQNLTIAGNDYTVQWTPSTAGTYSVKVGLFNADWSKAYFWNDQATTFTVNGSTTTTPPPTPTPNPTPNPTPTPSPTKIVPTVETKAATNINQTSAILNATASMNGGNGRVWFQYGVQSGSAILWKTSFGVRSISGTSVVTVSAPFTDLQPNTLYYYKVLAENYTGTYTTAIGNVMSFTTSAIVSNPKPTPTPAPAPNTPKVSTLTAADITASAATVRGIVNANGGTGTVWFEYSDVSGQWPYKAGAAWNSGNTDRNVASSITSLKSKTTYYVRMISENYSNGNILKTYGNTVTFTTK